METILQPVAGLDPAFQPLNFETVRNYIKPNSNELRWREIPWHTDLWEARRLALEVERPIFLWAMNGHPLGCV